MFKYDQNHIDLNGKTVLVTGGTGSFGHKFIKMTLDKYSPKRLVVFSRDEMKQWEMAKNYPSIPFRFFCNVSRHPKQRKTV